MVENQYNGMNQGRQSGGNDHSGLIKFLFGLVTGVAVAAPVTTLVVKKVCDNRKAEEVTKARAEAYSQGETAGMQAMAEVAKEEINKVISKANEDGSISCSKASSSASGVSNEKDIENGAGKAERGLRRANKGTSEWLTDGIRKIIASGENPFFDGVPEEKLISLVNKDMLDGGMSEGSVCQMQECYEAVRDGADVEDSQAEMLGRAYEHMLESKAQELRMTAMNKVIAEQQATQKDRDEVVHKDGTNTEDAENIPVTYVEGDNPQPKFTSYSSHNGYFGKIEDPESRAEFERKMAEYECPSEEDINDWNLTIDDEEATRGADEFSRSRVEYLEMLDKYKHANGEIPPMTISEEQFENEHRFEKSYINWYDEDDVFEENDMKIEDPFYSFGFVNGKEMFSPERTANREDPEICHVRNFKNSTDFEITRVHGSYAKLIADGEAYYHGETNSEY